jgi:hypothetical protein
VRARTTVLLGLSWLVTAALGVCAGLIGSRYVTGGRPGASQAAPIPPPDPKEAAARHGEVLRRFEADAPDAEWAPGAAQTFRADLETLGSTLNFRLIDAECRTSMCKATLQWPNYEAARKTYFRVVSNPYALNCASDIYVPPPASPADEAAAYSAPVVFDCRGLRAGLRDR